MAKEKPLPQVHTSVALEYSIWEKFTRKSITEGRKKNEVLSELISKWVAEKEESRP